MSKLKRLNTNLKLRLSLLRVWFMKNLTLFIRLACIITIICMFTGVINEDTPILGKTLYVIFSPLVSGIHEVIETRDLNKGVFTVIISILVSIGTFLLKVKNICKEDIKSDKLKYALYKANMYFNADGELVKKVEKATGEDIDLDGKVEDKHVDPLKKKGLFKSIFSSAKEFATIMSVELDNAEDENSKEYKEALESADLVKANEATEEIEEIVKTGVNNIIVDEMIEDIDEKISESEKMENEQERSQNISLFKRLKDLVNRHRRKKELKYDYADDEDIEIVKNNIETDSEYNEVIDSSKNEPVFKTETTTVEKVKENTKKEPSNSVDDFIANLKNRRR